MNNLELKLGQIFTNVKVIRLAINDVFNKKDIVWKKNEPDKCIVECKDCNCLWRINEINLKLKGRHFPEKKLLPKAYMY